MTRAALFCLALAILVLLAVRSYTPPMAATAQLKCDHGQMFVILRDTVGTTLQVVPVQDSRCNWGKEEQL